jgi:hypothetical protein
MQIAAHGKSTLGIPAEVGKDFVAADKRKSKAQLARLPLRKGAPQRQRPPKSDQEEGD